VTEKPVPKPEQPAAGGTAAGDAQAIFAGRSRIDRSAGAKETLLITVYYADGLRSGTALQPVQVRIPLTLSRIRVTVEQLIAAPEALRLHSGFPANTRVKGVNLNSGVAVVDLSAEAKAIQGSEAVRAAMASLVYSLTEIPNVSAVQLWVEGRSAVLHGVEWSEPLNRKAIDSRNPLEVQAVIKYGP
jgi:spore germination protein GerM